MAKRVTHHPEPEMVKQESLRAIVELRESHAARCAQVKELADALKEREAPVVAALLRGARIEPGPCSATVADEGKRSPKWKEAFIAMCGKAAAVKVLAMTKKSTLWVLRIHQGK